MMCTYVSEECWDGEGAVSEAPSLLSYTHRYVSLAELGTVCQFGLREPMVVGHFCFFFVGIFLEKNVFFPSKNLLEMHYQITAWIVTSMRHVGSDWLTRGTQCC